AEARRTGGNRRSARCGPAEKPSGQRSQGRRVSQRCDRTVELIDSLLCEASNVLAARYEILSHSQDRAQLGDNVLYQPIGHRNGKPTLDPTATSGTGPHNRPNAPPYRSAAKMHQRAGDIRPAKGAEAVRRARGHATGGYD